MPALDPEKAIPQHIAIIMDGNGRWAKARSLPRRDGHRAGADSVEECLKACGDLGVQYLTLYAFSSENWKRPEAEVTALMGLLAHFLKEKTPSLMKNNIRLQVIGQLERLPKRNQKQLHESIAKTAANNGLTLIVALSYGSREEIVEAARKADGRGQGRDLATVRSDKRDFCESSLHRRNSRPRSSHPHERRMPGLQLSPLADQLRGNGHHSDVLARLPPRTFGSSNHRISVLEDCDR
jgi:undecaprenyl diphosphate synthase